MVGGAEIVDASNGSSIIDITRDRAKFAQLKVNERDGWHKLWLYGYVISHVVMLLCIIVVIRLSRYKGLRKYVPGFKLRSRI